MNKTQIKKAINRFQQRLDDMQYSCDEEYHEDASSISFLRGQLSILENKSLKNIIKYIYKDEKRNYDEVEKEERKNHIFNDILIISKLLK